jgi:hypothetical protein
MGGKEMKVKKRERKGEKRTTKDESSIEVLCQR